MSTEVSVIVINEFDGYDPVTLPDDFIVLGAAFCQTSRRVTINEFDLIIGAELTDRQKMIIATFGFAAEFVSSTDFIIVTGTTSGDIIHAGHGAESGGRA